MLRLWRREGARKVVGNLAENDVALIQVEPVDCVEKWVLIQWVGTGLEVGDVVGEVRKALEGDRVEQVSCSSIRAVFGCGSGPGGGGGGFFGRNCHGGSTSFEEEEARQT